jgi:hypothetical protein
MVSFEKGLGAVQGPASSGRCFQMAPLYTLELACRAQIGREEGLRDTNTDINRGGVRLVYSLCQARE